MNDAISEKPNARQREDWNNDTGRQWLERHQAVDRQIAPFGRRAMDRAEIEPGQRVIDVGCGCGETTVEIAARVGDHGRVLGVDISRPLVEEARRLLREKGAENAGVEEADAQTFPFERERFDLVFSRFGIMFFEDPETAFRNLRSALRAGGRLSFVCWPSPHENQFMIIPLAAAGKHVALPEPGEPDAPGPFAFADLERVQRILSRSGFGEIETDRLVEKVGGGTLDETTDMLMRFGALDRILSDVGEQTRDAISADIRTAVAPFESSGRVWLDAVCLRVTARAV